ncbi:lantibiotic dehydratase [Caulobacter segnis]
MIRAGNFFLLRTPVNPSRYICDIRREFEVNNSLNDSRTINDGLFLEAIFLASANLFQKISSKSPFDDRLTSAIAKYAFRMSTRCTPFGLFAGVSLGSIGSEMRLKVAARQSLTRVCRLDLGIVSQLHARMFLDEGASAVEAAKINLNDTAWLASDGFRYVEANRGGAWVSYELARLRANPPVQFIAEALSDGPLSYLELTARLNETFDYSPDQNKQLIKLLVKEQFLVCSPRPAAIGDDAVRKFANELSVIAPNDPATQAVTKALSILERIDDQSDRNVELMQSVVDELRTIGLEVDPAKAIQIDAHMPAAGAILAATYVDQIAKEFWELRALLTRRSNEINDFAGRFNERYGDSEVPLLEALDEDFGIGFGGASKLAAPLLKGLAGARAGANNTTTFSELDAFLLGQVQRATAEGLTEIELSEADMAKFPADVHDFPSSFIAMGTLIQPSNDKETDPQFELSMMMGPSAMALLGRFCCGSDEMTRAVRGFLEEHEPSDDTAVIAEVAHLPEGRVGNVVLRPPLRPHYISYMGGDIADAGEAIALSDLYLSARNGRLLLYSRRLGRRVIPRLTNAHNFGNALNLPVYRFLGALQRQDEPLVGWGWSAVLDALPFLPGLNYKHIRLAPPRWRLYPVELDEIKKAADLGQALDALLEKRKVPQLFRVRLGDNFIEIDRRNSLDRLLLTEEIRRSRSLEVEGVSEAALPVTDEAGEVYRHEIAIPFVRPASRIGAVSHMQSECAVKAPGSDWLYARIYCGVAVSERIIANVLPPISEMSLELGAEAAFFIRYNEGGNHIRFRVGGLSGRDLDQVRSRLDKDLASLIADRSAIKVEYGTYQPEYERYGGDVGLNLCERLFTADSNSAQAIVHKLLKAAGRENERWRWALLSIVDLLFSLGLDEAEQAKVIDHLYQGYLAEFALGKEQKQVLNERYRSNKAFVDAACQLDIMALGEMLTIFEARRQVAREIGPKLRRELGQERFVDLCGSLVHMTANRLFPEAARLHELVLTSLVQRGTAAVQARAKYGRKGEAAA